MGVFRSQWLGRSPNQQPTFLAGWAVPGDCKFGRQSRRVLSPRTIRVTRGRAGLPRCWELPGWRGTSSEASSSTRWEPRRDVARRYCGERPPFAKYRAVREPHERSASHVVGTGPLHGWARFSVGRIILQRPKVSTAVISVPSRWILFEIKYSLGLPCHQQFVDRGSQALARLR